MHGQYLLIMFQITSLKSDPEVTIRRDWRNYTKKKLDPEKLCQLLALKEWNFTSDTVQDYWDQLENQLVNVVDRLAPLVTHRNNIIERIVNYAVKMQNIL